MAKSIKKNSSTKSRGVLIFVEGDTEEVFYNSLLRHYDLSRHRKVQYVIIKNIKGVGNYKKKASQIFVSDVLVKYKNVDFDIVCTYDNDVFKLNKKPEIDWKVVEKDLYSYGACSVHHVVAKDMIEDWFLIDLKGLCKYLGLDSTKIKRLKKSTGNEKMKELFSKKHKIYAKGSYCDKFIEFLDMNIITNHKLTSELAIINNLIY